MREREPARFDSPPVARRGMVEEKILDVLACRWSPRAFDPSAGVEADSLRRLCEAARWAPSSRNEQPWRYILFDDAVQQQREAARDCLTEGNQWARAAPVLLLSAVAIHFSDGERVNRVALHDLGAASFAMALQAQEEGLILHQMAGFDRERAREVVGVPDGFDPVTMIAVGHPGRVDILSEYNQKRERAPRTRRPISETVFHGGWGRPFGV